MGQTLNVNDDSMGRCDVYHMLTTRHVYINGLDWLTSWSTVLKKHSFSASHEMPTIYGNCKFITALLVPILCQIHPLHVPPPHPPNFFKIHCNIILPSKPRSSKWPLSLGSGFHTNSLYASLLYPAHVTSPTHLILFDFNTWIIFGEE